MDRPRFVVHQVRPPRVARQHPLRLALPQRSILDQRLDPGGVQQPVHGLVVGRLVVGERFDPTRRQVGAGLFEQRPDHLVVAHRRFGDPVGQGQFMADVDQQVELVAEPFHDLHHLAVVVLVLLATAGRLGQAQPSRSAC